jgi:DUF1707 SHOCT-like domain
LDDGRPDGSGVTLYASWLTEVPVVAGLGDERAAGAGGRAHLRASHADREQVVSTLKAAFVQGRLAKDEFDARVGRAFAARTYAELTEITDGIPAGPVTTQSPENTRVKTSVRAITAATVLLAGLWIAAWFAQARNPEMIALLISPTVTLLGCWLVTGSVALESRQHKRSGRPLPPRSTLATR